MRHRTRVERGDLVAVPVGRDERGRGADVIAAEDAGRIDPFGFERGGVVDEIAPAHGGAEDRPLTEHRHREGDVRSRAAAALFEPFDEDRDVELVGLLGQDVVAEAAGELHDRVECDRSGDGDSSHSRGRIASPMCPLYGERRQWG